MIDVSSGIFQMILESALIFRIFKKVAVHCCWLQSSGNGIQHKKEHKNKYIGFELLKEKGKLEKETSEINCVI